MIHLLFYFILLGYIDENVSMGVLVSLAIGCLWYALTFPELGFAYEVPWNNSPKLHYWHKGLHNTKLVLPKIIIDLW